MQWIALILGLSMTAVGLAFAAKRVVYIYRVITSGQPAPDRVKGVSQRPGRAVKTEAAEVLGQKKLLKWTVPGLAHFFVFWAFLILATVYLEAYIALFDFKAGIPLVGEWAPLGFVQDLIALLCLVGIITFAIIRVKNSPQKLGRRSRFKGSHLGGAYLVLFMIFNVLWTMFLFRGAAIALGDYRNDGAFASHLVGNLLSGLSHGAAELVMVIGLLLHIGVMLVFLIEVLHSKHLHIFLAPINVLFGRRPMALGAAKPMMNAGKPVTLDDFEDMDEDSTLGVGKVEDYSWKGILDFETCTECGRCQDQCPAWNTEKPLSPKLLIMAMRDHAMAKAPYFLAAEEKREGLLEGDEKLALEAERPLVGDTGDEWFYMPEDGSAAIDTDVLWSCVTCGACVNQCPVDIEHVDHIIDMRRYQVLVESNFPSELNQLFRGLENKGNPWNLNPNGRMEWAQGLDFPVKVVGEDVESLDEVEWLFWVGCAGAYEDRAKKTTAAVAELLHTAGVDFAVLGNGETCTGDSARRAGNEFVFQGLATQNVETLKETKAKKVVSTCAHCFNTLKNEYAEFGIELEVVHHTQLLNRLVREKKLTPVASNGSGSRSITYHDPCYIGRHNQVYNPPRELLSVVPGAEFKEMPRNQQRSFCCGAGGARMWMEETIGERINVARTKEAVATGADQIAVACPFCRVMLADGLTAQQSAGEASEDVEVLDVAQLLLASVKGEEYAKPSAKASQKAGKKAAAAGAAGAAAGTAVATEAKADERTKAEPEPGDASQRGDTLTDTGDVGPGAKASGGGSLFDMGGDQEPANEDPAPSGSGSDAAAAGGSLFDLGGDDAADSATVEPEPQPESSAQPSEGSVQTESKPAATEEPGFGGSLFDVGGDGTTESAKPTPEPEPQPSESVQSESETAAAPAQTESKPTATEEPGFGGSLFDIKADDEASGSSAAASTEASKPTTTESAPTQTAAPEPSASESASTSEQAAETPKAALAESHEPKKDADIEGSGSLFDL